MTPYQQAKAARDALDASLCEAGAQCMATRKRLALQFGIEAFNATNLTPDAIKFHPEYVAARRAVNHAFKALQTFNSGFVKVFRAEILQERNISRRTVATIN